MAGVYISWPFCAQKCTYCNFASGVFPRELEERYFARLIGEVRRTEWAWTPETVYLGGGTPASMRVEWLRELLGAVPGQWREATLEAAPGGIELEVARAWRGAGIDRVSLGVQSFVEAELRKTGRRHTAAGVARDVEALRGSGIERINIDLIAGLPHQTRVSWEESLDWVERLGVEHISVYMLEVDEDSRLGSELLAGGLRYGAGDAPGEELTVELYERAVERLAGMGLRRYEISNFAREGRESLHNLKYWRGAPYLGFGADAHSFDGAWRWGAVEAPAEYVARGGERVGTVRAVAEEERFFVGLRLMEGVCVGEDDERRYGAVFERFVREGLLERAEGRVRLTGRGVLLSNEVFEAFIHG